MQKTDRLSLVIFLWRHNQLISIRSNRAFNISVWATFEGEASISYASMAAQVPRWLISILDANFYGPCKEHKDKEYILLCLNCDGKVLCKSCKTQCNIHADHTVLQVIKLEFLFIFLIKYMIFLPLQLLYLNSLYVSYFFRCTKLRIKLFFGLKTLVYYSKSPISILTALILTL